MLAPERHRQILGRLEAQGVVRTIALAEALEVTDETIRRDLQTLEAEGKLTRVHGGASNQRNAFELRSFNERQNLNIHAKQAIAQAALSLIQPHQTYAFDSSTTALALVALLPNQPFRVITNAHAVMEHLKHKEAIELIATGGVIILKPILMWAVTVCRRSAAIRFMPPSSPALAWMPNAARARASRNKQPIKNTSLYWRRK